MGLAPEGLRFDRQLRERNGLVTFVEVQK